MNTPLLTAKLFTPPVRLETVLRPDLIERLNAGIRRRLTLVAQGASPCERPVAWLSLDEGDNDPVRFWAYVVAALRTVYQEAVPF